MITLFPKAKTKPEELPEDPLQARLAFLARHLDDLQTIRFAGFPIILMELPLLDHAPYHAQTATTAITVILSIAWYYLSRHWFRSRYGRSWATGVGSDNISFWPPGFSIGVAILGLFTVWYHQLPVEKHPFDTILCFIWTLGFLGRVANDRTNLPLRRTVYRFSGLAAGICLITGSAIHSRRFQLDSLLLYGIILFSVSLFDTWLLYQTFAQIKAQGEETA